jgi:hypothetical protein
MQGLQDECAFLLHRARLERERALNAEEPADYRRHVELARMYEKRLIAAASRQ